MEVRAGVRVRVGVRRGRGMRATLGRGSFGYNVTVASRSKTDGMASSMYVFEVT